MQSRHLFPNKTKQNIRTTGTISEWRQMPNVLRVKAVALGIFFLPWSSLKCNVQVFIRGCHFTWVCEYLCFFLVAVRAGDILNVVAGSDRKTLSVGSDGPQSFFWLVRWKDKVTTRECCRDICRWKNAPFPLFGFFAGIKVGASPPLRLPERRIS